MPLIAGQRRLQLFAKVEATTLHIAYTSLATGDGHPMMTCCCCSCRRCVKTGASAVMGSLCDQLQPSDRVMSIHVFMVQFQKQKKTIIPQNALLPMDDILVMIRTKTGRQNM